MSMVYIGTHGRTAKEISQVFHLYWPGDQLSQIFDHLNIRISDHIVNGIEASNLPNSPNFHENSINIQKDIICKNELGIANALWVQQGYPILPLYRELIQKHYQGEIIDANFNDPNQICAQINAFVSEKTRSKITKVVKELPNHLVIILINAIYFFGAWLHPFKPQDTQIQPFFLSDSNQINIPLMQIKNRFHYTVNENLQYI
jgi:serine protease inhibitor